MPTLSDPIVGRKKSKVPTKPLRVAEDVYHLVQRVAAHEDKDPIPFLSDLLRPILEKMQLEHARRIVEGKNPPPKK